MRKNLLLLLSCYLLHCGLFAQWQSIDGPSSGRSFDLVQVGDRLYVTTFGGLYQSDDNGENWTTTFTGSIARNFPVIKADGENAIVRVQDESSGEYLYQITTDGGDNWASLDVPAAFDTYRGMAFNGEVIIHRTANNHFASFDRGETWESFPSSLPTGIPGSYSAQNGLFYYPLTNGQLFRSTDASATEWEELNYPFATNLHTRILVSGDTILAGIQNGNISYSHDDGLNWTDATGVTNFDAFQEGIWESNGTFYATDDNVLVKSEDGGVNWNATPGSSNSIYSDVLPLENDLLLIRSSEVHISPDEGVSLSLQNTGISSATVRHFQPHGTGFTYVSPTKELQHAGLSNGVITRDSIIETTVNMDEMLTAPDGSVFYIEWENGNQFHHIRHLSPEGNLSTVRSVNNQPWLNSDHLEFADGKLFYFGNDIWEYSEDMGATWQPIIDMGAGIFRSFTRHDDAVYALAFNGLSRKRDGESEWVIVDNGINLTTDQMGNSSYAARLISTENALFAFVPRPTSTTYDVYVTYDEGANWQVTATDLPGITYPTSNNAPQGIKGLVEIGGYHIMAARDVGVAISNDQGRNWIQYNEDIFTESVEEIQIIDGKVVVSTTYKGFWQLDPADIQLQQVRGQVYFDTNENGNQDSGETGLPDVKVLLENGEDLSFTDNAGDYNLLFRNGGDYGPVIDNPYFTSSPASRNTDDTGSLDFGMQLTQDVNDLRVKLETDNVHRPGFTNAYYLTFENRAALTESVVLELTFDEAFFYEGASQAPDQVDGNTLTYFLGTLQPLQRGTFVLNFRVDETAQLGVSVNSTATISSMVDAEFTSEDNTVTLSDQLVGSYDPNDIAVDLVTITPAQVNDQQILNYRIRFQNTGTFPAERVVVRNFIEAKLDISSIANINSSHDYEIEVEGERTLAFVFNNIDLADSTRNEAASHGYITYSMTVEDDLVLGDSVFNQAAIYFDFNAPIITNQAYTVVEMPSSLFVPTQSLSGRLYPNPARSGTDLQLQTDAGIGYLSIYDQQGRLVQHQAAFNPANGSIKTVDLAQGIYFVVLNTEEGQVVSKLVLK